MKNLKYLAVALALCPTLASAQTLPFPAPIAAKFSCTSFNKDGQTFDFTVSGNGGVDGSTGGVDSTKKHFYGNLSANDVGFLSKQVFNVDVFDVDGMKTAGSLTVTTKKVRENCGRGFCDGVSVIAAQLKAGDLEIQKSCAIQYVAP